MNPEMTDCDRMDKCIPRVSGDEPTDFEFTGLEELYSPRERG